MCSTKTKVDKKSSTKNIRQKIRLKHINQKKLDKKGLTKINRPKRVDKKYAGPKTCLTSTCPTKNNNQKYFDI